MLDQFADWLEGKNVVLIAFIFLAFAFLCSVLLKTAWGTWHKRDK